MTLDQLIRTQTDELRGAGIASARLDVLVLLSDALEQDKAWLLAHGDQQLDEPDIIEHLRGQIARRKRREPLSYIRGQQEFYGRRFMVNPHVLIPRPETETLIELVLGLPLPRQFTAIDVGTGSGIIAVTLKLERPAAAVLAIDSTSEALEAAEQNARNLHAGVTFLQSNLLQNCPVQTADVVIANLPYVSRDWQRSPETDFEPANALFAGQDGLGLIYELIDQVGRYIRAGGYVALEADPVQHGRIVLRAQKHGLRPLTAQHYALLFQQS